MRVGYQSIVVMTSFTPAESPVLERKPYEPSAVTPVTPIKQTDASLALESAIDLVPTVTSKP